MKPDELSDRELLLKALSDRPSPTILAEWRRRQLARLKAEAEHRGFFKREQP